MKSVLILGLVLIVAALAAAGLFMLRRPKAGPAGEPSPPHKQMARALAVRVGLSVFLFLLILFSYFMGWIQPTGIPLKAP